MIATKQIEMMVRVPNGPAALGRLIAVVSSCGTEVLAACSYWDQAGPVVMLVTENPRRATCTLEDAGFKCKSNEVVLVETPDKPGLAALLGQRLAAAGVNILYSYAFRSERHQSYVVFKTSDDDRALYIIGVEALIHELAAGRSWRRPGAARVEELDAEPQAA
ncbi:MAG TPA: hypothetical protein VL486_03665 [Verrucomicrobiae bacterium]|nr:hypothetical protein [Verrucomicrobiae bacterium]